MNGLLAGAAGGAVVSVVIKAVDQASPVFSKVNKNLLGIGAGVTAIGVAGAGVMANLAKSGSDLNETVNAVNVTFGETSDEILNIGKNAAKSFGLSQKEFNGMAVSFSNFATSIVGEGGNISGTIESLIGRGSDFASVYNLEVNEALGLFRSGLAGETEPLRKYGIDVSAAAVKTYAYANGIAEAGKELTEQQKVQARYGLIMEQTNKVQGDFQNTSDSLANRQRILKASFEDLKASLGTSLLPIFESIVGIVQKAVNWFSNLSDGTKKFIVISTAVASALALIIGPLLMLIAVLPALVAGFTTLSAVSLPITGTILAIAAAIGLLIAGAVILWKKWDKMGKKMKWLMVIFFPLIALPVLIIKEWDKFAVAFKNIWIGIRNTVVGIWNFMVDFIEGQMNSILKILNKMIGFYNMTAGKLGMETMSKIDLIDFSGIKGEMRDFEKMPTNTTINNVNVEGNVWKENELVDAISPKIEQNMNANLSNKVSV